MLWIWQAQILLLWVRFCILGFETQLICPINDQSHIAAGFPILLTLRESGRSALTSADNQIIDQLRFLGSPMSTALQRIDLGDACLSSSGNVEIQNQLAGAIPITSLFQSTSLAPVNAIHENTKDSTFPDPQFQQLETFRTCILHSSSNASNSSFASSLICEGDESLCNASIKWENDRFHCIQQLSRENPEGSDFQAISSAEHLHQNGWMPSSTMSSKLWNELSLSLATSEAVLSGGTNFLDQYSQLAFSSATQPCLNSTELASNLNSDSSRDLSLSYGCSSPVRLSRAIAGSRYLSVIQDVLSQIASYPLEGSEQVSHSTTAAGFVPFSSSSLDDATIEYGSDVTGKYSSQMEPEWQKLSVDAKKSHLLTLLQLIDERYTQCLDEIHTVTSAFHAATDLDPRLHTRYTLQTITSVYRNLRWHSPSEHTINGKRFAMEAHLVHQSLTGKVAVIGVLYNIGRRDSFLSKINEHLEEISDTHEDAVLDVVDPSLLRMQSSLYYRYIGSLTVPPCSQNVLWTIVRKVRTVSPKQVKLLRVAVHDDSDTNARPLQPINDRRIQLRIKSTIY